MGTPALAGAARGNGGVGGPCGSGRVSAERGQVECARRACAFRDRACPAIRRDSVGAAAVPGGACAEGGGQTSGTEAAADRGVAAVAEARGYRRDRGDRGERKRADSGSLCGESWDEGGGVLVGDDRGSGAPCVGDACGDKRSRDRGSHAGAAVRLDCRHRGRIFRGKRADLRWIRWRARSLCPSFDCV